MGEGITTANTAPTLASSRVASGQDAPESSERFDALLKTNRSNSPRIPSSPTLASSNVTPLAMPYVLALDDPAMPDSMPAPATPTPESETLVATRMAVILVSAPSDAIAGQDSIARPSVLRGGMMPQSPTGTQPWTDAPIVGVIERLAFTPACPESLGDPVAADLVEVAQPALPPALAAASGLVT